MTNEHLVSVATLPDDAIGYDDPAVVRRAVREALAGADASMRDIVPPGATVLLKPNWVLDRNLGSEGMDCLVTHPTFIEAVLDEVAAASPGRIVIGDAPIQSCDFDALVPPAWRAALAERVSCPVDVVDFRRAVVAPGGIRNGVDRERRPLGEYALFDLGAESHLEPITVGGRFRVTSYDPRRLAESHGPGRHRYLVTRAALDADVVINLPKLKTHKKAGMTGALKNLVGINGDKDFLPHHRLGGTSLGGDCYRGFSPGRFAAELLYDAANRRINTPAYDRWIKAAARMQRLQGRFGNDDVEGSWQGNDTVWRMVLDLNTILRYGRSDGTLADSPARTVYSITDAIVGGQREGPLASSPVALGAVTFARSSAFADVAHCALLRFDWRRVPTVHRAFAEATTVPHPLVDGRGEDCTVVLDGSVVDLATLAAQAGHDVEASRGWRGHVELVPTGA